MPCCVLRAAGWEVQDKGKSLADLDNLEAGLQSFREVLTSLGDRG